MNNTIFIPMCFFWNGWSNTELGVVSSALGSPLNLYWEKCERLKKRHLFKKSRGMHRMRLFLPR